MKKETKLIIALFIVLSLYSISNAMEVIESEAFVPFGIPSEDGSALQIFYTESNTCETTTKDYRIPQDKELLPYDYFCVFLSIPDNKSRTIHLDLYGKETIETRVFDESQGVFYSKNVTDFTKLIKPYNLTLSQGDNEWNDKRFALVKVDSNTFIGFNPSDEEQMIKVNYNKDVAFNFIHQTDYSRVPVTESRGEKNLTIIMQLAILVGLIIISVILSRMVYFKVGTIFPKVNLSTAALLLTWFMFALFFYVYLDTESVSETSRQLLTLRPEMFSVLIAGYMFLWLPSQYRPDELGETLLIALDIPFVSAKDIKETASRGSIKASDMESLMKYPRSKRKKLYSYIDKSGQKQYAKNPDSYLDLISRALFGGLKLDFSQTIVIPDANKKDELIFVLDFKEKEVEFVTTEQRRMIYLGLMLGVIGSLILALLIWNFLVVISVTLAIGLIMFYVYENVSTKYNYELNKCTRNVLSAMYDVKTVKMLDNEVDILLHQNMELERENMLSITKAKGEWMLDWESELFPENFEELFGADGLQLWNDRMKEKEAEREKIRSGNFDSDEFTVG